LIKVHPYNLPDLDIIDSASAVSVCVWHPDKTYLVLGQSNKAETSLDMEAVLADGITVVKRPSGGETVILTPNTLVIAISFTTETLKNPKEYFHKINDSIIAVLAQQGIQNLLQKGISDIAIGEKKILGSSIYRRPNRVFYHAVLNVAEDIANIAKYIRHPAKEPDYRKGRPHSEFVTSIREQGYDLSVESLLIELEKGMRNLLPTEF
jgi:lipoate-protein ligase A